MSHRDLSEDMPALIQRHLATRAQALGRQYEALTRRAQTDSRFARRHIVDVARIARHLASQTITEETFRSGGWKALARRARRLSEHPATINLRARVARRGILIWSAAPDVPPTIEGVATREITDSADLAHNGQIFRNCIGDFEQGLHDGHYRMFVLGRVMLTVFAFESLEAQWVLYETALARHHHPDPGTPDAIDAILVRLNR